MSEFFRKSLYRPYSPRLVRVERVESVSPGLLSVTLTGDGLEGFPAHCPAAHVKLFLPREGQGKPALPVLGPDGPVWPEGVPKPLVRTYSVRRFRQSAREIDIEFAVHGVEGPATRFARNAMRGDYVGLSYPGGPDPMIPPASFYVLAGDLSAAPGVASILEALPVDARGHALLRADRQADVRTLVAPSGVHVRWFVGGPAEIDGIFAAFKAIDAPEGETFYWVGGEHSLVVAVRSHLVGEKRVPKDSIYALPYWRRDLDEEGYHAIRDEVMNEGR